MLKLLEPIRPEAPVETKRIVNPGAEKWIGQPIKCLNKGFIYLVDYMGGDSSVAQAARVSYGKGTKKKSTDRGLVRFLMRHGHTSPFEMLEFKFHLKAPLFVIQQWLRHRTASVNQLSARYSEMPDEFYLPSLGDIRKQSKKNRQGRSDESVPEHVIRKAAKKWFANSQKEYTMYQWLLAEGIARELARIGLPASLYTELYWKIDLHNLFHFLKLRLDERAQYEIRVYAQAIAEIIKETVPDCFEAFEDYNLHAMALSRPEQKLIVEYVWPMDDVPETRAFVLGAFRNETETEEFLEKLRKLGLIRKRE